LNLIEFDFGTSDAVKYARGEYFPVRPDTTENKAKSDYKKLI